jgi:hypothetical protein
MIMNLFKNISVATVGTAAISFSLISTNPAQAATFKSETEYNVYGGNTLEFTFEDLKKSIGDVTLSVFAGADLDKAWEIVNVSIDSDDSFTDIGNVFDGHISSWGGIVSDSLTEGVDTITISESLFNSLDDIFTIKLTPNGNVNNNSDSSYAYLELDYVEKVPEPGTIAGLILLCFGSLMINKKRHSNH